MIGAAERGPKCNPRITCLGQQESKRESSETWRQMNNEDRNKLPKKKTIPKTPEGQTWKDVKVIANGDEEVAIRKRPIIRNRIHTHWLWKSA